LQGLSVKRTKKDRQGRETELKVPKAKGKSRYQKKRRQEEQGGSQTWENRAERKGEKAVRRYREKLKHPLRGRPAEKKRVVIVMKARKGGKKLAPG